MQFLSDLWMPILVSAVIVFFASFLTHMVIPLHKNDFDKLPDEDKVMDALRGVPASSYSMPYCEHNKMNDPEWIAKADKGPMGIIHIWPGQVNMGKNLGLTFMFYVLVGIFVAYIGWHAFPTGSQHKYMDIFRMTGAVAFAAHGLGWMPMILWYGGKKWFWPYFIEAIVYAMLTGGVFGWLWPKIVQAV